MKGPKGQDPTGKGHWAQGTKGFHAWLKSSPDGGKPRGTPEALGKLPLGWGKPVGVQEGVGREEAEPDGAEPLGRGKCRLPIPPKPPKPGKPEGRLVGIPEGIEKGSPPGKPKSPPKPPKLPVGFGKDESTPVGEEEPGGVGRPVRRGPAGAESG